MTRCRVLIADQVLRLPKPSRSNQDRVLAFLDSLAATPFQKGDYQEADATGRPPQIKIVGDYALTFWVDHGEKEVKVIRLETADRK